MATTYKDPAQVATSATTLTDLLTTTTQVVVSTVIVCNRGGSATTFRIAVAPAGAADATSQYLYFDVPIAANDTMKITFGLSMASGSKLRVYAGNANLSFSAFYAEVT